MAKNEAKASEQEVTLENIADLFKPTAPGSGGITFDTGGGMYSAQYSTTEPDGKGKNVLVRGWVRSIKKMVTEFDKERWLKDPKGDGDADNAPPSEYFVVELTRPTIVAKNRVPSVQKTGTVLVPALAGLEDVKRVVLDPKTGDMRDVQYEVEFFPYRRDPTNTKKTFVQWQVTFHAARNAAEGNARDAQALAIMLAKARGENGAKELPVKA